VSSSKCREKSPEVREEKGVPRPLNRRDVVEIDDGREESLQKKGYLFAAAKGEGFHGHPKRGRGEKKRH